MIGACSSEGVSYLSPIFAASAIEHVLPTGWDDYRRLVLGLRVALDSKCLGHTSLNKFKIDES